MEIFYYYFLQHRHAQTVKNGAPSQKIDNTDIFSEILSLEGHQHLLIGLKVTAILLNEWILPYFGDASGRVWACRPACL